MLRPRSAGGVGGSGRCRRGSRLLERLAADRLHEVDARLARAHVVLLPGFGGLSVEEAALSLGLSRATVERHLELARALLRREFVRLREPNEETRARRAS